MCLLAAIASPLQTISLSVQQTRAHHPQAPTIPHPSCPLHALTRAPRTPCPRQTLGFVNAQLFNQLLLRPELCRAGNARYALRGLKQVDGLLLQVTD